MRVTPEQFQERRDIRTVEMSGKIGQLKTPKCENCGRATEFLFHGFIYPEVAMQKLARSKSSVFANAKAMRALRALSTPFQTEPAEVCMRCRPPSNIEIEEMLAAKT